jgi:hypothetical protein
MSLPSESEAARLFDRASADTDFEQKLRAGYLGRHDVLDALWWLGHPFTTSPRGVMDPASQLRELQRAAFSRSSADSPIVEVTDPQSGATRLVPEAARQLDETERMLANDARHLADALASAAPAASAATPASAAAAENNKPAIVPAPLEGNLPAAEVPSRPRRKYLVPAVSIAAVLAAIIVFPSLPGINADADTEPVPTSTSPVADRVKTEIVTLGSDGNVGDPLALLDRPQTPEDRPTGDLRLSPDSYRALPDLVQHSRLYLARGNQPETICLVVIREDELSMSTCQPESEFDGQLLRLGGGRYEVTPGLVILTESYELLSSGDFHYEATARMTGESLEPAGPSSVIESG